MYGNKTNNNDSVCDNFINRNGMHARINSHLNRHQFIICSNAVSTWKNGL